MWIWQKQGHTIKKENIHFRGRHDGLPPPSLFGLSLFALVTPSCCRRVAVGFDVGGSRVTNLWPIPIPMTRAETADPAKFETPLWFPMTYISQSGPYDVINLFIVCSALIHGLSMGFLDSWLGRIVATDLKVIWAASQLISQDSKKKKIPAQLEWIMWNCTWKPISLMTSYGTLNSDTSFSI
jgi:hypothetical protein